MPGAKLRDWNHEKYARACQCNIAHTKVFDIDQVAKAEIVTDENEALRKVKEALLFLHLSGRSNDQQDKQEDRSINCTHFLTKALHSISYLSEDLIQKFEAYWGAFSMVSIQLINCAQSEKKTVPADFLLSSVSDIFSEQENDSLRRDITNGVRDLIANVETCAEWEKRVKVLGNAFDKMFVYWHDKMRGLRNYRNRNISEGSAGVIDIWCYLTRLYVSTHIDSELAKKHSDSLKLLYDQIFNKVSSCLGILEIFCKLKGSYQEVSCLDNFLDQLHFLRKLTRIEDIRKKLMSIADDARDISKRTRSDNVRRYFNEMISILDPYTNGQKPHHCSKTDNSYKKPTKMR